jgi:hypothetical protein
MNKTCYRSELDIIFARKHLLLFFRKVTVCSSIFVCFVLNLDFLSLITTIIGSVASSQGRFSNFAKISRN